MCPKARADGDHIGVWEGIDIKRSRSHLVGANEDSTTMNDPKYNFSKNEGKLEQPVSSDNWMDRGRVAEDAEA